MMSAFGDTATGQEKWRFIFDEVKEISPQFSPDSKVIAVPKEGSIRILAATTGKEFLILKLDFSLDCNFAFTADSQHLVTVGADHFARVWDVTRNDIVPIKHDEPTRQFVCNPKRSLIASADADGVVRVWSADDGATIVDDKHDRITHLTFSPNGELLATASEDATAHVLDVQKRCRIEIFKHLDAVSNVTFSADGKLLATTSKDRTARVWDVRASEGLTLMTHPVEVKFATFSPDSRYLATADGSETARIWPVWPADLINQARARITRPLTDEERRAFDVGFHAAQPRPSGHRRAGAENRASRRRRVRAAGRARRGDGRRPASASLHAASALRSVGKRSIQREMPDLASVQGARGRGGGARPARERSAQGS